MNQTTSASMLRKSFLPGILFCVSVIGFSQERALEAWWLEARFTANETTYEGIDVSTIDPMWSKITTLSYELLPTEAKDDLGWMRKDGFGFAKEGHLGSKQFVDRAVVGVFEDRSGKGGRFLLVLRRDAGGTWKKLFLHQEAGDLGFSVLVSKGGKIYWGTCMQCDEFRKLVINAKGAYLF